MYSIKVQLSPLATSTFSVFLSFLTFPSSLPFQNYLFIKLIPLHFNDSMLILFLYLAPPISPFPPDLSYLEKIFLEISFFLKHSTIFVTLLFATKLKGAAYSYSLYLIATPSLFIFYNLFTPHTILMKMFFKGHQ